MYSLLKETKTCQARTKPFLSGKALRSHTRNFSTNTTIGSTTSSFNKLGENSRLRETVLMRSIYNSEVVGGLKSSLNQKGEQQVTIKKDLDNVSWKDLQYDSPVEEVALCLIQISEGKRTRFGSRTESIDSLLSSRKRKDIKTFIEVYSEDNDENINKHVDEDEYEEAYFDEKCKKRTKYLCDICGKFLGSYQALGGHRTSHRHKRLKISDENQTIKLESKSIVQREYKCQICNKVFESGQALGGHKKAHS